MTDLKLNETIEWPTVRCYDTQLIVTDIPCQQGTLVYPVRDEEDGACNSSEVKDDL